MKVGDEWIAGGVSVAGQGHKKASIPCQDASIVRLSKSGNWVALVVSDGAGSAARAQEGSSFIANFFSEALIRLTDILESRQPGQWLTDYIIERIVEARDNLRVIAQSDDLKDYHCTLVACLIGPSGGFALHIGDGAVYGGNAIQDELSGNTELNANFFISSPENGEFANETYFITESNWIKHLRITPLPRLDWVYVCTDGGTALSLVSDMQPKSGFIVPVLKSFLEKTTQNERDAALLAILVDSQAGMCQEL